MAQLWAAVTLETFSRDNNWKTFAIVFYPFPCYPVASKHPPAESSYITRVIPGMLVTGPIGRKSHYMSNLTCN